MQNKKLKRISSLIASFATASLFAVANSAPVLVSAEGDETTSAVATLPLIELSMKDANPQDTIKNLVIQESAQTDSNIDINNINIAESTAEIVGFDRNLSGIQTVTAKINLVYNNKTGSEDAVGYSLVKNVAVKVEQNGAPTLKLKSNTVTVNNGDAWNPTSYVSFINDDTAILPVLEYSGNVDMNTDGTYTVTYTATDVDGNSTTANLNVVVQTPQEVIEARTIAEEAKKKAEEEKKKAQEEAKKAAEQMQNQAETSTERNANPISGSGSNPYSGGWGNCTWGAWQAAHSYTGANLPNWGDAGSWIANAKRTGYSTGSTPVAGSVVVYSNHVAFVTEVSGDQVHIVEGNFNGHYNERWVSRYGTGTQSLRGYVYLGGQ